MSCTSHLIQRRNFAPVGINRAQNAISCGFNAGHAIIKPFHRHDKAILSGHKHEYPVVCEQPTVIHIERVAMLPGVDNVQFLIGDVRDYRMGKNFLKEIPRNAINVTANNFPTFLLLKEGNMHTLGFSTANIEECLRRNRHMFSRDGIRNRDIDLLEGGELAPQDWNVNEQTEGCGRPKRIPVETVISNSTMNDSSTTIRIDFYECGQLVPGATEVWYVIRIDCESGDTAMGANLAKWDDNPGKCGGFVFIPGRSTDNGVYVIANYPDQHCGHGHAYHGGVYAHGTGFYHNR